MPKQDHPSLYEPGIHAISVEDLHDAAVVPFAESERRPQLFERLCAWMNELRGFGISGTLWIDGSFLTRKPEPDDIDMVGWNFQAPDDINDAQIARATELLDKGYARAVFNLDFYHEVPEPEMLIHRQAYWKGFLGFCHDTVTAKGFVELVL